MKKQRTRKCATHLDSQRIPFGKNGTRCLECLNDRVKKQESKYLLKAKLVHGNEFDYSLFHFKELKEKVKIICRTHGVFEQHVYNHLKGEKCPSCLIDKLRMPMEVLLERFRKIHRNTYDYSAVEYVNSKTKVKILCKKHGYFTQTPGKHMAGQGCPRCRNSYGENLIINFLKDKNIDFI